MSATISGVNDKAEFMQDVKRFQSLAKLHLVHVTCVMNKL